MFFARAFVFGLFVVSAVAVFAQGDDQKAAERQRKLSVLVDQINEDAANLKLPENRAFIYAKLGSIAWRRDANAGRSLFEKAITELIAAQGGADTTRKSSRQHFDFVAQNIRPQILQTIAGYDAEMALEALARTRPTIISDALRSQPGKTPKISNYGNNSYFADNERNLEQMFTRMAAEQNPERAAKLLKDALKKNITGETLNLLKKLYEKDPASASSLASEIADKLIRGKFTKAVDQPDNVAINAATSFLSDFIRDRSANDKSFAFNEAQMRPLADRLIAFYLDQSQNYGYFGGNIVQIAERFAPNSVEQLKKIGNGSRRHYGDFGGYDPELQKVLSSDATAEQIVALTSKYPSRLHGMIYQTAARKLAQSGNIAGARQLIRENYEDDSLDNALADLNWQEINILQSQSKFADAEAMIDQMPESNRVGAHVNLANRAYGNDRDKNATYAAAVLAKARQLIGERPENSNEMQNLFQIVVAYSRIDPRVAFAEMESLVPQINEITDASIKVSQYQGNTNIRNGEAVMINGYNYGVYFDFSSLPSLARVDFNHTMNIINSFSRIETRILLRLQLAENGLE